MFRHLLVPLDGSGLAETVLPAAAYLSETLGAAVTLIHIIEEGAAPFVHGERHLTRPEEADQYLEETGRRFFPPKVCLKRHVHTAGVKEVSAGIVLHESELAPDLVVMCTHGRGGLRGLLFGRIAQQVVEAGTIPVLLIRPEGASAGKPFVLRMLLAPTDGTPLHAEGLEVAFGLARALKARLELVAAVPTLGTLSGQHATAGRLVPGATRAVLDLAEADLSGYLKKQVERFQGSGVATGMRIERGEPAAVVIRLAEELDVDGIVMGSHGKSGTKAFWTGSISARVLAQTLRPLLLVPV
jgi:nucleotide-binding universal stress UspA family protein